MSLFAVLVAGAVSITQLLPVATGSAPVFTRTISLPGVSGRIDHIAYDGARNRLFVAALENGSIEVIDLAQGERVASLSGLHEPQGIVFVPSTHQVVVACGGDGMVIAYDTETLQEVRRTPLHDDADNVRLDPDGHHILVGYADGAIAILDAQTLEKTGEIALPGHPESFQPEPGTSRVFINVPGGFVGGGGKVVVGDRAAHTTVTTWKPAEAGRNFPMALDAAHKRLYLGCRRPAKLVVIDTDSGLVLAAPDCVGDADDVFVDPQTSRVLVIGGDGAVDVFETTDYTTYAKIASFETGPGARTGLLVPEGRTLFVAVPTRSGRPAELREYSLPD